MGQGDNVSTEDLRVALQRYRAFFDRLLSVQVSDAGGVVEISPWFKPPVMHAKCDELARAMQ